MDSSRRVSDVSNTCVGGEFESCVGMIRPFPDDTLECVSESIMLQKTCGARAGGELNKVNFRRCYIHQHNSKRIRITLSSSLSFSFLSSFFVVFVVSISRADRGIVYMHVLEKFGGFGGFVATGLRRFEHVRRR